MLSDIWRALTWPPNHGDVGTGMGCRELLGHLTLALPSWVHHAWRIAAPGLIALAAHYAWRYIAAVGLLVAPCLVAAAAGIEMRERTWPAVVTMAACGLLGSASSLPTLLAYGLLQRLLSYTVLVLLLWGVRHSFVCDCSLAALMRRRWLQASMLAVCVVMWWLGLGPARRLGLYHGLLRQGMAAGIVEEDFVQRLAAAATAAAAMPQRVLGLKMALVLLLRGVATPMGLHFALSWLGDYRLCLASGGPARLHLAQPAANNVLFGAATRYDLDWLLLRSFVFLGIVCCTGSFRAATASNVALHGLFLLWRLVASNYHLLKLFHDETAAAAHPAATTNRASGGGRSAGSGHHGTAGRGGAASQRARAASRAAQTAPPQPQQQPQTGTLDERSDPTGFSGRRAEVETASRTRSWIQAVPLRIRPVVVHSADLRQGLAPGAQPEAAEAGAASAARSVSNQAQPQSLAAPPPASPLLAGAQAPSDATGVLQLQPPEEQPLRRPRRSSLVDLERQEEQALQQLTAQSLEAGGSSTGSAVISGSAAGRTEEVSAGADADGEVRPASTLKEEWEEGAVQASVLLEGHPKAQAHLSEGAAAQTHSVVAAELDSEPGSGPDRIHAQEVAGRDAAVADMPHEAIATRQSELRLPVEPSAATPVAATTAAFVSDTAQVGGPPSAATPAASMAAAAVACASTTFLDAVDTVISRNDGSGGGTRVQARAPTDVSSSAVPRPTTADCVAAPSALARPGPGASSSAYAAPLIARVALPERRFSLGLQPSALEAPDSDEIDSTARPAAAVGRSRGGEASPTGAGVADSLMAAQANVVAAMDAADQVAVLLSSAGGSSWLSDLPPVGSTPAASPHGIMRFTGQQRWPLDSAAAPRTTGRGQHASGRGADSRTRAAGSSTLVTSNGGISRFGDRGALTSQPHAPGAAESEAHAAAAVGAPASLAAVDAGTVPAGNQPRTSDVSTAALGVVHTAASPAAGRQRRRQQRRMVLVLSRGGLFDDVVWAFTALVLTHWALHMPPWTAMTELVDYCVGPLAPSRLLGWASVVVEAAMGVRLTRLFQAGYLRHVMRPCGSPSGAVDVRAFWHFNLGVAAAPLVARLLRAFWPPLAFAHLAVATNVELAVRATLVLLHPIRYMGPLPLSSLPLLPVVSMALFRPSSPRPAVQWPYVATQRERRRGEPAVWAAAALGLDPELSEWLGRLLVGALSRFGAGSRVGRSGGIRRSLTRVVRRLAADTAERLGGMSVQLRRAPRWARGCAVVLGAAAAAWSAIARRAAQVEARLEADAGLDGLVPVFQAAAERRSQGVVPQATSAHQISAGTGVASNGTENGNGNNIGDEDRRRNTWTLMSSTGDEGAADEEVEERDYGASFTLALARATLRRRVHARRSGAQAAQTAALQPASQA